MSLCVHIRTWDTAANSQGLVEDGTVGQGQWGLNRDRGMGKGGEGSFPQNVLEEVGPQDWETGLNGQASEKGHPGKAANLLASACPA